MNILVVPTFSDPSYVQNTSFEGSSFVLQFDYNQRAASWYLSIADASGVDIYNGIKLSVGMPLLRKCTDVRRPPGELFVMSSTADTSPPSLLDLLPGSGRCQLLYVTSDLVAAIQAASSPVVSSQWVQLPSVAGLTNGSAAVTFFAAQALAAFSTITFGSQPGVSYQLASAVSGTSGTLTQPYSGPTAAGTTVSLQVPTVLPAPGIAAVVATLQAQIATGSPSTPQSSYGLR